MYALSHLACKSVCSCGVMQTPHVIQNVFVYSAIISDVVSHVKYIVNFHCNSEVNGTVGKKRAKYGYNNGFKLVISARNELSSESNTFSAVV